MKLDRNAVCSFTGGARNMFSIIVMLIGGLGLFIYGMNLMSKAIERVAGYGSETS